MKLNVSFGNKRQTLLNQQKIAE